MSAPRRLLTSPSALRSGALTGLGQIALAGAAVGAGALLAQKFGRNARTDGFLAAYAVYTLLVLAAQSLRMIVVPDLTRAAAAGRLGGELRAYALAYLALATPVCVAVGVLAHPLGELVTGSLPEHSAHVAARALVVLVPAAFVQLFAALAASGLAALDSYGTAAAGFGVSGLVGLAVFAALAGSVGIVALAWGLLSNAIVALVIMLAGLRRKRGLVGETAPAEPWQRLSRLFVGAAAPLALQAAYLVELRLAAKTGFALGVISSAPLTRRGVDQEEAGRHVVHAAWVSLSVVGVAAGVLALVGGRIVHTILGDQYGGRVGRDLGLLVVYLSPWMVAWIGFVVTYPLVFVAARRRWVLPVSALGVASSIPLGLGLRAAWGLPGLAIALGLSTLVTALGLLAAVGRRTLEIAALGLARIAVAVGVACALAFGPISLALPAVPAALVGVVVYVLIVLALRAQGLSEAWTYVRGLQ